MRVLNYYDKNKLDPDLKKLALTIRRRLRKDKDLVIGISGGEGTGKTTLGIILGALIDPKFDLERSISLIPNEQEIKEEFNKLGRYQCYMIDEAIRSLYKMNFMSNLQQMLIQMWATERYQNKATIMIIPRFKDLTEYFRNHRVKLWIHVFDRGRAVLYLRDDNPYLDDPWHLKDIDKKFKKAKDNYVDMDVDQKIERESKRMNYFDNIFFPDLPEELKKKYFELRQESREIFFQELKEQEETQISKTARQLRQTRDRLIHYLMKIKKPLNYEGLEEITTISKPTLMKIVKSQQKIVDKENLAREKLIGETGVDKHLAEAIEIQRKRNIPTFARV